MLRSSFKTKGSVLFTNCYQRKKQSSDRMFHTAVVVKDVQFYSFDK